MVLHQSNIILLPDRTIYTTLCGRQNAKSHDGMNIAAKREQVTCKLCLSLLAKKGAKDNRDKPTSAEEAAAVAKLRRSIGYTPVEVINMARRDREEEARTEGIFGYPMEWDNDN